VKKLNAGDRCQVESAYAWIPATILTVYPGHSGAMVLPDDWATSVWAKAEQIRPAHVAPDPHDVAYQGEIGDHQPYAALVDLSPNIVSLDSRRHQTEPTDFQKRMAYVGVEGEERDAYLEVILEFAKMGLTAEQIMPYVAALGRIIIHGFTPDELDNNTTHALRARYTPPHANLHHIPNEYRD